MIQWYTFVEVGVAVVAGVFCLAWGLLGRKPNDYTLGALALVELTLVIQLIIAIASPFAGNNPTGSLIEFYVYLVAAILLPVLGAFWALVERDRWSVVILGIVALAVAVMMWRMNIIWTVQVA